MPPDRVGARRGDLDRRRQEVRAKPVRAGSGEREGSNFLAGDGFFLASEAGAVIRPGVDRRLPPHREHHLTRVADRAILEGYGLQARGRAALRVEVAHAAVVGRDTVLLTAVLDGLKEAFPIRIGVSQEEPVGACAAQVLLVAQTAAQREGDAFLPSIGHVTSAVEEILRSSGWPAFIDGRLVVALEIERLAGSNPCDWRTAPARCPRPWVWITCGLADLGGFSRRQSA